MVVSLLSSGLGYAAEVVRRLQALSISSTGYQYNMPLEPSSDAAQWIGDMG